MLSPDRAWEGTFAMPFSGGAWYDEKERRVSLFYRCGGRAAAANSGSADTGTCLAYSADGVTFTKPALDANGTNFVRRQAFDGNTVWLDRERNQYVMAEVIKWIKNERKEKKRKKKEKKKKDGRGDKRAKEEDEETEVRRRKRK